MKRILVTGGAGFVGTNFVHHVLASTDLTVTVLDNLTYAASPAALESCRQASLVVGDVGDAEIVEPLVASVDAVVHFAAESHNDNSLLDPTPFIQTNLVGTFVLLEAARRHKVRFHHVSTDEVYGDLKDDKSSFTESSQYRPSSPYSATKAGADHLVRAWARSFDVAATVSNCSNNYGPWQHVEKFVPRQITELLDGRRPRLYGDGLHMRDWIHVADHSSAILAILERGLVGETYLIGSDEERSNLDVVRELLEIFERPANDVEFVTDRAGHDRRYALDSSKIRRELGWSPGYKDLLSGLADTVEWYRQHEAWWRPAKGPTEAAYEATGQ